MNTTPTIEEQLDKILAVYRDRVSAADDELQTSSDPEVRHNWHKLASEMKLASGEAKAALTLLITKAVIDELEYLDSAIINNSVISAELEALKATTQEDSSV